MLFKRKRFLQYFVMFVLVLATDSLAGMIWLEHTLPLPMKLFTDDTGFGKALHRVDAAFHFTWPPGSSSRIQFRTNNFGFREDRPTEIEKTLPRIIVFGDSHTDGMVENKDSFANQLEDILSRRDTAVEVINAGVGFFSLYEQYRLFKKYLFLAPDLAIFTFYTGNDWKDILNSLEIRDGQITEKPGLAEPPRSWQWKFFRFAKNHSLTLLTVRRAYLKWRESRAPEGPPFEAKVKKISEEGGADCLWQSFFQAYYFREHPGDFEISFKLHRYTVSEIQKSADEAGVKILFLILPSKYEIEPETDRELFARLEKELDLNPATKFESKVREAFVEVLNGEEAGYVDASSYLRENRQGRELYWKNDHHLNPAGHRLTAEVLLQQVSFPRKRESKDLDPPVKPGDDN